MENIFKQDLMFIFLKLNVLQNKFININILLGKTF